MNSRTIDVKQLARVEGEGRLYVQTEGDRVVDVKLNIFEPPRLFEGILRGRAYSEAPDITARICGICPIAYQMSAVHAMENAFGVAVGGQLRALRRLIYCGEWIESHVLHAFFLHAPDFFELPDAIQLARQHPSVVTKALEIKKAGNRIMAVIGGREIHPINVRVGGFYRVPTRRELGELVEPLERAREFLIESVRWASALPFPDFEKDYEFVSLRHESEYPFNEGRVVSNKGLDISHAEFDDHFEEEHVAHSTALHCVIKGRGAYLTGPLARYALNYDKLTPAARDAAKEAGLEPVCKNPFKSILVRLVETFYACDEALRLISEYDPPDEPCVAIEPLAATGFACTEAPRGMLYHRYTIDRDGTILDARIVPPTSQNQKSIEDDVFRLAGRYIQLPDQQLQRYLEQGVRNHDPCISCATHFLRFDIQRG